MNTRLDGHADHAVADYAAASGGTSNQYYQYLTLRIGAIRSFTPNCYAGPSYQYVHRWSNQFNSDYDQNVVMLRLGARL